jgi:hypothetical protein
MTRGSLNRARRDLRRAALAAPLALLLLTASTSSGARPGTIAIGHAPLMAGAAAVGALRSSTPLHLTIVLNGRRSKELAAVASAVSTPGSPDYHHYLTVRQFAARFGASPSAVAALRATLRSEGLVPGALSANGLSLAVSGDSAHVSRAFGVRMRRYRILHGRLSVYANTAAPRVPAALGGVVRDVLGLDDVPAAVPAGLVVAGPAKKATRAGARARAASAGTAPQACAAASTFAAGHLGTPRTIDQVAQAYGIDGLYAQGDFGAGVTVALDELEGYQDEQTDVAAFEQCFGIQPPTITPIEVDNGPGTYSPSAETSVDIQNLIGLAPAVKIDLYQGPNAGSGIYDVMTASVTADTAQVINWSWGECEATVPASLVAEEGALIQEAAAQGQTFIASSGDRGSEGCISMNADWGPEDNEAYAVEDPTSQPFATSVGASVITSLGQPPAETVWNVQDWGAGGGGVSSNSQMPNYQAYSGVPGVISSYSSGTPCGDPGFYCREVPDVSANGGAPQGYAVFYNGAWLDAGGTSTAAPVWTAVAALADASGDSGCSPSKPLGFLNPLLYEIAAGTGHASAFNDITTGSNNPTGSGAYPATPGYDMATGLGSPMATDGSSPGLVAQLCNASLIGIGSAPTITGLSTNKAAAGSTVTITGQNFTPYTAVWFGLNTYASQVTYVSPTELIATVPAGSGTVAVIAFKESGSSGSTINAANGFTFAPTATISSPPNGSVYTQGQGVSAAYSCAGAVSCSGPIPSGSALDTSSLGEHSFAVTAKDGTGFTTTTTSNYVVVPPPTVAITGPASGATYAQGQVLAAQFSCSASEPLMIQSCSGPVADGAAVDTSTSGSHSFTVSATDSNGITTSQTVTYTVVATLHASVSTPANGADYVRGSVVHASYSCSATAPSHVVSCAGTASLGAPIDTKATGTHHFTLTATSSDGATTTTSVTYTVVAIKPTIAKARESNPRWLERAHHGAKLPVGTTFSFSLDQPATVTLKFTRAAGGRMAGGRCVAPSAAAADASACTRSLAAGALTLSAHSGANALSFAGHIRGSSLPPGVYSVVISAKGLSGRLSSTVSLHFRIAVPA